MKSFENSQGTFFNDEPSHEYSESFLKEFKSLERLKADIEQEQEYLKIQNEDLDQKIEEFTKCKESFEFSYRKKQENLRKKENELIRKEADLVKKFENFDLEKEKWTKVLESQLVEIENKELELEAQREELATELEKCQILGESLHKIQADIRAKSVAINDREKVIKVAEDRVAMKKEDLRACALRMRENELILYNKERELLQILEFIERKTVDIQVTSEMFEKINVNLIEKSQKLEKESDYLAKSLLQLDKDKALYKQKFKKLQEWEALLESKAKNMQNFKENYIQRVKTIESIEFREVIPSVTTEEDEEACTGFNVLTPRSNESDF